MAAARLQIALLARLLLAPHAARELDLDPEEVKDHRGNIVAATVAETLWSVRVLKASTVPNTLLNRKLICKETASCTRAFKFTFLGKSDGVAQIKEGDATNLDLVWNWVELLKSDGFEFLDEKEYNKMAKDHNKDPAAFAAALSVKRVNFKAGMDKYIGESAVEESRAVEPDCKAEMSLSKRNEEARKIDVMTQRGRDEVPPEDWQEFILPHGKSLQNMDAGIASQENVPPEAKDFFPEKLLHHGKSGYKRNDTGGGQLYAYLGAPFCSGASGSILYMVLSMENDREYEGKKHSPKGYVSCKEPKVREALLGVMIAILIALGQHSLTECLAVVQAMGYFKDVSHVLADYKKAAGEFERYLADQLGVSVGEGEDQPLVARMEGREVK